MQEKVLKAAVKGLTFAGIGSLIAMYFGFNQNTLTIFLYLYIAQAVYKPLKNGFFSYISFSPDIISRLVIVAEGEELKMKKLLTGEKYRLDGDVEKL